MLILNTIQMKSNIHFSTVIGILFLCVTSIGFSQVAINGPVDNSIGASLQVTSTDKGFLIPRIQLTGTNDNTSITPSPTIGLIVFNPGTAGSGGTQVNEGFYYYAGASFGWRRLMSEGFSLNYKQTNEVRALLDPDDTDNIYLPYIVDLPGLDTGNITVPFTGRYQFIIKGYMAAGDLQGPSGDGASQGSISLVQDIGNTGSFTLLKESYITSSSKDINGTFFENLARCATIVFNVDLVAGTTYRFKVQGREWLTNATDPGWFGKNTSGYAGANGVNDAQYGSMVITLVAQN